MTSRVHGLRWQDSAVYISKGEFNVKLVVALRREVFSLWTGYW